MVAQQKNLTLLFPLVKMLLAIPATSADDERAFSSASFTLDYRRTRLDIASFQVEHRIRRYLISSTDHHSAKVRRQRVERLLERFAEVVGRVAQPAVQ